MVEIKTLFAGLQRKLLAELEINREINSHPGAKGENTEIDWRSLLEKHFPERYCFSKGFVVDCRGNQSLQIDLIVHDRQYTPIIFYQNDSPFIPAESVYAVFEIKQELDGEKLKYAGEKAESVRKLYRTSAPIPYVDGTYKPKKIHNIFAGILTNKSSWSPPLGDTLEAQLNDLTDLKTIELGCALTDGTFTFYNNNFQVIGPAYSLAGFIIELLEALQKIGTVPAIDWDEYKKALRT